MERGIRSVKQVHQELALLLHFSFRSESGKQIWRRQRFGFRALAIDALSMAARQTVIFDYFEVWMLRTGSNEYLAITAWRED
jgi:hypothetical protein